MCVRVSQGNNVIIAMYVICICMSHVCIFVLYFALQIWRIIKYLSIYLSIYHFPVLLYTNHIRFTFMDIQKTLIKMVNSKKLRVSSKGTRVPLL